MGIQDFLDGHADAAIWLGYDWNQRDELEEYDWGSGPTDESVSSVRESWLSTGDRLKLDRDAREFYRDHLVMLIDTGADMSQLGHDFALSRAGHGTGFWDRGYPNGDELHAGSKPYGDGPMVYIDDTAERVIID